MRTRSRRVAAVSRALLERLAPTAPGVVVPNSLEPAEWSGDPHPPDWLAALSGPLLVYAGTLDARLDVAWLAQTAAELPEATLVLVGPLVDADHFERCAPYRTSRSARR